MVQKNSPEKFWNNIDIRSDNECWEWKNKKGTRKYAETKWHGKYTSCHRKAFELFNSIDIPDGKYVCHTCDNPPCCNPKHLFLGTHQDNVDDRERKGRNKMPHSLGEDHGQHKLTREQVIEIRSLYETSNHTYDSLAEIFGVCFSNIRNIIKRKTWAWL
jgi:hypothetical protein